MAHNLPTKNESKLIKINSPNTPWGMFNVRPLWYDESIESNERNTVGTGTNNISTLPSSEDSKFWNFIGYSVLFFIMAGQALSAVSVLVGSLCYLTCNILALWRCFALNRPIADKVKDLACLGLTVTILIVKFIG